MTGGQETALERQSRLRERARQLREKREAERLAFVEQKYEQQFRSDFDQWRIETGGSGGSLNRSPAYGTVYRLYCEYRTDHQLWTA